MVACIISMRGQKEASSKTSPLLRTTCKSGFFPQYISWVILRGNCLHHLPLHFFYTWNTFNVVYFRRVFLGCRGNVRCCGPLQNKPQQDFLFFQFIFCLRIQGLLFLIYFPFKTESWTMTEDFLCLSCHDIALAFGLHQDMLKRFKQVIC